MQTVNLGNTGISTSRLGFGTGTHGWNGSSEQTRIGHDKLVKLLRSGYDQGVRLWDSADGYGSHSHLADAMEGLDRSSVVIISKTHSKSPETVREEIPRFLRDILTSTGSNPGVACNSKKSSSRRLTKQESTREMTAPVSPRGGLFGSVGYLFLWCPETIKRLATASVARRPIRFKCQ